jgi:small-conductance mechanosensitive channel
LLPDGYVRYVHVAEVAIAGYIIIELFGNIVKKLLMTHSEMAARSIKSVIRIAGAVIVMAVIISYLSQDPVIAASLSTISGIVIGFAASNLIGNAIAGIYLAIARPFRIGDKIKVFGEEGTVIDIGILYTRLLLDSDGDHMLASNSSMVSSNIILKKGKAKGTGKSEGNETGTGKSSASSDQ